MGREISPLDGRYAERLTALGELFSEYALVRARCTVELAYLRALDEEGVFPRLSEDERTRIDQAEETFGEQEFARVKAIESEIRHDVKACELFLREWLRLDHPERIHFGLTSEDVNNVAYALLLNRFRIEHQLPRLRRLITTLADRAEEWESVVLPARTHGQPASPTTAGKEMAVFLARLVRQARRLAAHRFSGKWNGATGTYAALVAGAPDVDWRSFSRRFVEGLDLDWSPCTTQIEGNDTLAEYLDTTVRINRVVLDLDLDLWQYISRGEMVQRAVEGEVGSSVMPHKINPIHFENSEGNLIIAQALLHAIGDKLTQSRMQRDLSGSTVMRNVGVALTHAFLAWDQTVEGLLRVDVDRGSARAQVEAHPEVLGEAIQTILRVEGFADAYDRLKRLTRGRATSIEALHTMMDELPVDDEVRGRLKGLRPATYIGLADRICKDAVHQARAWLNE